MRVRRIMRLRRLGWHVWALALVALLAACGGGPGGSNPRTAGATPPPLARPAILAGYHVFVSDLATGDVAELGDRTYHVSASVHGLGFSNDGRTLFVSDISGGSLVAYPFTNGALGTPRRVRVGLQPVHMLQSQDGHALYVT